MEIRLAYSIPVGSIPGRWATPHAQGSTLYQDMAGVLACGLWLASLDRRWRKVAKLHPPEPVAEHTPAHPPWS